MIIKILLEKYLWSRKIAIQFWKSSGSGPCWRIFFRLW